MENIKILMRLQREEMTAEQFIMFCKKIVLSLKKVNPEYKLVSVWDDEAKTSYYFNDDLSDFNNDNCRKIIMVDDEIAYTNTDPKDKKFSLQSKSWMGFTSSLCFNIVKSEEYDFAVSIFQGSSSDMMASINVEFAKKHREKININLLKNIILSISQNSILEYAVVISTELRRKVKVVGQNLWIGFITFFRDKNVMSYLPDSYHKELSDNGCFVLLKDESLECNDANTNEAIEIRDILAQHGVLNYKPN